jgi:hypothetical protein
VVTYGAPCLPVVVLNDVGVLVIILRPMQSAAVPLNHGTPPPAMYAPQVLRTCIYASEVIERLITCCAVVDVIVIDRLSSRRLTIYGTRINVEHMEDRFPEGDPGIAFRLNMGHPVFRENIPDKRQSMMFDFEESV